MLHHECDGIILPYIYYLFGLCTPMADFEHGVDEHGNPLPEDCGKNYWATYYSTPEAMSSFENLYQNNFQVQDRFIDQWELIVKAY